MDYIGYECPVCKKPFHAYEDIVVCPECGTPHHRVCYLHEGHCHFEEKHGSGFEFDHAANDSAADNAGLKCRFCGTENNNDALFCKQCGNPIQNNAQQPYGQQQNGVPPFDPFGGQNVGGQQSAYYSMGINPEEEIEEGVTAGDISQYVRNSSPYYIRVFQNIKRFSKSRFNFAAFLFSGGFLLYRKQYKLGAIITVIMVLLILASNAVYFSDAYKSVADIIYNEANSAYGSYNFLSIYAATQKLDNNQLFIFGLPSMFQFIEYIVMFCVGLTANRYYYKNCIKNIRKIKASAKNKAETEELFQTSGGVNTAIAISIFVLYVIINYVPNFLMMY